MKSLITLLVVVLVLDGCRTENSHIGDDSATDTTKSMAIAYAEHHRPQFHFSPQQNWMNDPNGMVYYNGEFHLFYQHYPEGNTWGPMHWGHAVSKDMIRWEHLPIALYPDSLGYIFSGSAVVDWHNTSGLGTKESPALVAIYTYHSALKEKEGRTDYQYQGMAYSLDNGRNWEKYEKNPLIANPGITDFRDPKVFWHKTSKKWIMILAVKDHTELWGSPDLKHWKKLSEFGAEYGAHGGVWECPDLFEAKVEGESRSRWIMIVSINPGGPNGGSATQYFTGDFNGTTFTADQDKKTTLWLDYGPDNYAGVTWSNAPEERNIFLGWMSNWAYAQNVPTTTWRSANTLPRDLTLIKMEDGYHVRSNLSPEVLSIATIPVTFNNLTVNDTLRLNQKGFDDGSMSMINGTFEAKDFTIEFSNPKGQKLVLGFDAGKNIFFIDRGKSGANTFSEAFVPFVSAPRLSASKTITLNAVVDVSSIEVFFDEGLSVLTTLYFPDEKLSLVEIKAPEPIRIERIELRKIISIWNSN